MGSALLFLIIAEVLANRIRMSREINFVKLANTTDLRISMYADDTTLFPSDQISIRNTINIITKFGAVAGPKLNFQKTKGLECCKLAARAHQSIRYVFWK